MSTIASPACRLGYTRSQLEEIVGARLDDFHAWMYGQTQGICDGRRYNHDAQQYEPTACADEPHGVIVYMGDLRRFLAGLEVID